LVNKNHKPYINFKEEGIKKSTKEKEESQFEHEFVMQSNDNTHFLRASSCEKAVERACLLLEKMEKDNIKKH
jgi:hypothetical protein